MIGRRQSGWPFWGRLASALATLCFVVQTAAGLASPPSNLNLGWSSLALGNTNRTDTCAAMKAWFIALAKERHMAIQVEVNIFDSTQGLEVALKQGNLDFVVLATEEFATIIKTTPLSCLFCSQTRGRFTEQYVLLVNRDRKIQELKELRGESLVMFDHPRSSLAKPWLEVELRRQRLPGSKQFFGKISQARKPDLAILSVFFNQAGAAVVTQRDFEIASELNPQMAKRLCVLARSSDLVPILGVLRGGSAPDVENICRDQASRVEDTQAGRQFLNLFQADRVVEVHRSDLVETLALLGEFKRIRHD